MTAAISSLLATTTESKTISKRRRQSKAKARESMPSTPSDPVIAPLHEFIREERKRNFFFLGRYSHQYRNPEELVVVNRADPDEVEIIKQRSAHLKTAALADWYTFTELIGRCACTVAISMPDKDDGAIEGMLVGNDAHHMLDAATWIRNRCCTDPDDILDMKFTEMQYEEHRMWWESTEKAFGFLNLPLELRIDIYLHIIIPDIVTQFNKTRPVFGIGQSCQNMSRAERHGDPEIQCPNMAIMLVNKQVHKEALAVATSNTVKRFTVFRPSRGRSSKASAVSIWTQAPRLALQMDPKHAFLRYVQLEMSAHGYFASIGIHPEPGHPLARGDATALNLQVLSRMQSLQTLDLCFISPRHQHAKCPWMNPHVANQPHSCQKKWIDLFFIFAWDILHALATCNKVYVSLSGCIKHSTHRAWQYRLNDVRANHTPRIKVLQKEATATKTDDFPLPCHCTCPCADSPNAGALATTSFADHEDGRLSQIEGWQDLLD